jgi:hypothetical protein
MNITNNNLHTKFDTTTILKERLTNITKADISLQKNTLQVDLLLKELFSNLANNTNTKTQILSLLQQLPVFKNFGGLGKELNTLVKQLQQTNINTKEIDSLKSAIIDIKKIDGSGLKNSLGKSGIFLENYIKNFINNQSPKETFIDNIKTSLLNISESPNEEIKNQVNKIISQMEYFSLFSLVNDSNKIPLSFDWNDLNDGDIEFFKETNELHTCQINLDLDSLGEIKINLSYDKDENINIAFLCDKGDTKNAIQDNVQALRHSLNSNHLKLQSLGVHDLNEKNSLDKKFESFTLNNYSIDIKA